MSNKLSFHEWLEMLFEHWFGNHQVEYDAKCMEYIFDLLVSFYQDYRLLPSQVCKHKQFENISTPEELLYKLLRFKHAMNSLYD